MRTILSSSVSLASALLLVPCSVMAAALSVDIELENLDIAQAGGEANYRLFLNGEEQPVLIENEVRTIELNVGDTLRLGVDGFAASMGPDSPTEGVYANFEFTWTLGPGQQQASVIGVFTSSVDTSGVDGFAETDGRYSCRSVSGCSFPSAPSDPDSLRARIISDSLNGNVKIINGESLPTGQTGGLETFGLSSLYQLTAGSERDPSFTNAGIVDLIVREQGQANAAFVWEFTVVPVPATGWLFISALGLLGWLRRRSA